MKGRYDKKAVSRSFNPGDQVLVLLPVPGSSLSACFSGPYVVDRKVSDTNYVVETPERRRSSHMCHVNMLKAYHVRGSPNSSIGRIGKYCVRRDAAYLDDVVIHSSGWAEHVSTLELVF